MAAFFHALLLSHRRYQPPIMASSEDNYVDDEPLTLTLRVQKQQKMISESIRNADTAKLAPPMNETDLIQQLVCASRIPVLVMC